MFFPIGTDRRLKHKPLINTALIVANIAVSVFVWYRFGPISPLGNPANPANGYMLFPAQPALVQFFSYQFLHADWEHLLLNMLFLYVFGNSLEDRLGPLGYLAFYLAGGVFAGVGHCLVNLNPILGASGSIAAVTGAFLALFPLSRVTIAFLFVYFFEVSSIFVIGLSVATDLVLQLSGARGVAYLAHLAGYAFGFVIGMGLLGVRVLPREPYDFLALVDRWNRRRQWREAARGHRPDTAAVEADKPLTDEQQRTIEMRNVVRGSLASGQPDRAVDTYERLLQRDADQVMDRQAQLDLANHAMAQQRHGTAARAYELYLKHYRDDEDLQQVQLLLGLVYARYLGEPEKARPLLTAAREKLGNDKQRQLADQLLQEIAPR